MMFWLARRIIESLLIVAVMAVIIYGLISLMPGDPIDLMVFGDPNLTAADAARLKSLLGLDQPWQERFWEWAKRAIAGEFGYSRLFGQPVLPLLTDYLVNTALLMGCSFLLSLIVGGYLGILAATKRGTGLDSGINFMFFLGVSVPAFWVALILILVFAVELSWLPSGGIGRGDWQVRIEHAILPIISLSIRYLPISGVLCVRKCYKPAHGVCTGGSGARPGARARVVCARHGQRITADRYGNRLTNRSDLFWCVDYRGHVFVSRHGKVDVRRHLG